MSNSSIPNRSRNAGRPTLPGRSYSTVAPVPSQALTQQQQRQQQRLQQQRQQQQQQQQTYSEPILPADYVIELHPLSELYSFLNELGFPIQEQHLQRPTSQIMLDMYEFLSAVLIHDSFDMDQEVQSDAQHIVPDFYENTVEVQKIQTIYKEIKTFLKSIRFRDFSLNDVLQPTAQRTRLILSVIYNYEIHAGAAMDFFESYASSAQNLLEEAENEISENEALEEEVGQRQEQYDRLESQIEHVQAESSQIEAEINQRQTDTDVIIAEINQLKQERQSLKDDMQQCHYHVLEIAKQLRDLTNIINLDVDQMVSTNEGLREENEQKTQLANKLQQEADSLDREYTLKKSLFNDIDKVNEAIRRVNKTFNETDRASKSKQALSSEIFNLETKYRNVIQAYNLLERQVAQKEMQIQKLTDQQEKKRESMMNFYSQINEINQESDSHYNKCAEEAETFRAETNSKLGECEQRHTEYMTIAAEYLQNFKEMELHTFYFFDGSQRLPQDSNSNFTTTILV